MKARLSIGVSIGSSFRLDTSPPDPENVEPAGQQPSGPNRLSIVTSNNLPASSSGAMGEKRDFGYLIRIKKKKSDKAPNMEGQLEIAGQRFDLAGWIKLSKKGNKYLSILATPQPTDAATEAR
jgi:hypothetical protein